MPNKIYIDDIALEIIIDIKEDISTLVTNDMLVLKNGVEVTWAAAIYNDNFLRYVTADGDLDVAGMYYIHPDCAFPPGGWDGLGELVSFRVWPKWH